MFNNEDGSTTPETTAVLANQTFAEFSEVCQLIGPRNIHPRYLEIAKMTGFIIGLVSCYEYGVLGWDFAANFVPTNTSLGLCVGVFSAIVALVPNSAINLLVNLDIFEDLVANPLITQSFQDKLLLFEKTVVLFQSAVSSFALTMLMLNSMLDEFSLWLCGILAFVNFVSNLFILYYCQQEFVEKMLILIRDQCFGDPVTTLLRRQLLNRLSSTGDEHSLALWKSNRHHLNEAIIKELLQRNHRSSMEPQTPHQRLRKISTMVIGGSLGIIAVTAYLQIGTETTHTLAAIFKDDAWKKQEKLAGFLGISTFLSFLFFSLDQTGPSMEFTLTNTSCRHRISWFTLFMSALSAIPNAAIALRFTEGTKLYIAFTVFCSALAPTFVNNKWFSDLVERIRHKSPSVYFHLEVKKACILYLPRNHSLEHSQTDPLEDEIERRKEIAEKQQMDDQLRRLQSHVPLLEGKYVRALMLFGQNELPIIPSDRAEMHSLQSATEGFNF